MNLASGLGRTLTLILLKTVFSVAAGQVLIWLLVKIRPGWFSKEEVQRVVWIEWLIQRSRRKRLDKDRLS